MINELGKIEYEGIEYPYVFNINVIEQVQSQYGSITAMISALEDVENWAKPLKFVLREMINEAIDIRNETGREDKVEFVNNKKVGRIATEAYQMDSIIKIRELTGKIVKTLISEEEIKKANQKNLKS